MKHRPPYRPADGYDHQFVVALDIETIPRESANIEGTFPPITEHLPVVASLVSADWQPDGSTAFGVTSIVSDGDEAMFIARVEAALPRSGTLVTFNGRGFDLPVLAMTALASCSFACPNLSALARAPRFGGDHADLADLIGNFGGARGASLKSMCERLGIPIKTQGHGSSVAELWAAGERDAIVRYCEEDTLASLIAFKVWLAMRDAEPARMIRPLGHLGAWLDDRPDLDHLHAFATCAPVRWARARLPGLLVADALADAELRLRKAREERAFRGPRGHHDIEDDTSIF